jgi:2'-5' RNA ligase
MTDGRVTVRSFVAVALPGAVRSELWGARERLARELGWTKIRWLRKPENLHVTIKFLGDIAAARLDALGDALDAALSDLPPFGLSLRGLGAFPSARQAKIVFAGVQSDDAVRSVTAVARIVDAVAADFGVEPDQRPFTGHVTIGRSKEPVDLRAPLGSWSDRGFGAVQVDEVHVYESQLAGDGDEGSTYVLRHSARLAARAH